MPVGVRRATHGDLATRLTSDDPAILAAALGLEPALVPPEVQAGFPTLQIVFDSAAAEHSAEDIWVVPATVTQQDRTANAWSVTVLDTPLVSSSWTPLKGRPVKRLGSFIVTAALAVGLLLVPTSASAAAGVCPKPSGVAPDTKVAILIHGWLGSEMVKGREILVPMLGDDWSTITYDYKAMNTLWPSSSLVAQCLSEFARDAQNMTGRDKPSVYFVGHSMGGIMARFALELYKEDVAKYAAGVVTLDTPHTGSPWGGSQVSMAVEAGAHWWNRNDGTKKDGAKCLSLHHPGSLPPECKYPPAMPEAVPIAQIAGNATITRTYFHFGRQRADIMTDGTVWLDSQVGYKKSLDDKQTNTVETSYTVYCDLAWGDAVTYSNVASPLATVTGKSARWLSGETLSLMQSGTTEIVKDFDSLVVLQAVSNMASCGHNVIPQDTEALTAAASYLKNWAAKTDSWLISAAGVAAGDIRHEPRRDRRSTRRTPPAVRRQPGRLVRLCVGRQYGPELHVRDRRRFRPVREDPWRPPDEQRGDHRVHRGRAARTRLHPRQRRPLRASIRVGRGWRSVRRRYRRRQGVLHRRRAAVFPSRLLHLTRSTGPGDPAVADATAEAERDGANGWPTRCPSPRMACRAAPSIDCRNGAAGASPGG